MVHQVKPQKLWWRLYYSVIKKLDSCFCFFFVYFQRLSFCLSVLQLCSRRFFIISKNKCLILQDLQCLIQGVHQVKALRTVVLYSMIQSWLLAYFLLPSLSFYFAVVQSQNPYEQVLNSASFAMPNPSGPSGKDLQTLVINTTQWLLPKTSFCLSGLQLHSHMCLMISPMISFILKS